LLGSERGQSCTFKYWESQHKPIKISIPWSAETVSEFAVILSGWLPTQTWIFVLQKSRTPPELGCAICTNAEAMI
jgi:hypothetical protein